MEKGKTRRDTVLLFLYFALKNGCIPYQGGVFLESLECSELQDCHGPPLTLIYSRQQKMGTMACWQGDPCTVQLRYQEIGPMEGSCRSCHGFKAPCPTGASVSCNSSIGIASRVPAIDIPVTRATPLREAQNMVSPSVFIVHCQSFQSRQGLPIRSEGTIFTTGIIQYCVGTYYLDLFPGKQNWDVN